MTTINQDIRGALQEQLADVANLPLIAYEGVKFRPTVGVPFCAAVVLSASGRPFDLASKAVDIQGSFEIAVAYPNGTGTGTAEAMADAIRAAFKPNTRLEQGAARLTIRYAERRSALLEEDWVRVPVSIGWRLTEKL